MTTAANAPAPGVVRSLIPARIDRLPWSPFHTRMVVALGIAWILDGLEITVASSVTDVLTKPETLGLSSAAAGLVASVYLAGEVVGALFFGRLSDKLGRRNLFMITLAVYLVGSGLTALTLGNNGFWIGFLYLTRFIAGMGIGGEYAAINSAIDEMMPVASFRGRVDIMRQRHLLGQVPILGTLGSLHPAQPHESQRSAGGSRFLHRPDSRRWCILEPAATPAGKPPLADHARPRAGGRGVNISTYIEREVEASGAEASRSWTSRKAIEICSRASRHRLPVADCRVLFKRVPVKRSVLGATLMITQSFLYNAIFFTYTLVLGKFFNVDSTAAPWFLIAFAVGNLTGPLTIGHLFDTIGRRKMIAGTYVLSGLLLGVTAVLFYAGVLNAVTMTIAWCVIFYFASAGASAAYLTVSEIFPLEVRSKAIAVFFAIAQCFGAIAPAIYGALIGDGSRPVLLFFGYLMGGVIMIVGGVVAFFLAVDAEGKSLEDIAAPLAASSRGYTRGEGAARPR